MEDTTSGSTGELPATPESIDSGGTTSDAARRDADLLTASLPVAAASWRVEPLSEPEQGKVADILSACRDRDHARLAHLASTEGGFVEDHVRRTAWPIVLGCSDSCMHRSDWRELPRQTDEEQVKLDVHRSFVYYPKNEDEKTLDGRKDELSNVITEVLRRHPMLHYFQGYHDIVQVLLLVLGAQQAVSASEHLSLLRIRDFMLPTINGALDHLHLLPAILQAVDPALYQHLSNTGPFFALSSTLTMFAHDVEEYSSIARLFDFLLAREAIVSVYLIATVILSRKDDLLEIDATDSDMLHFTLAKLPKPLDLEALISRATSLFADNAPETLPFGAWSRISRYSVLKTTRRPADLSKQTLGAGEKLFAKQAAQLDAQESRDRMRKKAQRLLRKYRRPAGTAFLAIGVALIAYCLRNTVGVMSLITYWTGLLRRC